MRVFNRPLLIWADKVAIGFAVLLTFAVVVIWGPVAPGQPGISRALPDVLAYLALPAWIALRLFDVMIGGPARRERLSERTLR